MRCRACDASLTDIEAVRKWPDSEEYTDLCSDCLLPTDDAAWAIKFIRNVTGEPTDEPSAN